MCLFFAFVEICLKYSDLLLLYAVVSISGVSVVVRIYVSSHSISLMVGGLAFLGYSILLTCSLFWGQLHAVL